MDQKTLFISDYLCQTLSFSELCALYHVSRKTGYKWVARYEESGAAGLAGRSPRPHQTPAELADAIAEARRLHPTWGAGKLLALLRRRAPDLRPPVVSIWTKIAAYIGTRIQRGKGTLMLPDIKVLISKPDVSYHI